MFYSLLQYSYYFILQNYHVSEFVGKLYMFDMLHYCPFIFYVWNVSNSSLFLSLLSSGIKI